MKLDEHKLRLIEQATGTSMAALERVNGLAALSPDGVGAAIWMASQWGGLIAAVVYLRHVSGCTLREAVDFLDVNGAQYPS